MANIGAKTLSGLFVGYSQEASGTWSGDLLIADWGDLERAETAGEVHVWRVAAKEVLAAEPFRYPLADGTCRQPAGKTGERYQTIRYRGGAQLWPDAPTGDVHDSAQELSPDQQTAGGDSSKATKADHQDNPRRTRTIGQ